MSKKGFTLIRPPLLRKVSCKGFTLIELLVVISIIALLALVGINNFLNASKNARDGKRKSDVQDIVNAYEMHYDASTDQYQPLQDSWFTSGKIPTPPDGGSYSGLITSPSSAGFQICATLESSGTFCKQSAQITYVAAATPTSTPGPANPTAAPTAAPSATPGPLVSDSFNRADNASSLGSGWNAANGIFGISSNQAYISSGCPAPGYAVMNAGITDATIQVTVPTNAQDVRIPFRYVDLNNMYWLENNGGGYQINKFLAGTRSQPASSSGVTPANGDVVKIVLKGGNITVYINGTSRISYNDTSNVINGTNYGIGTWCGTSMRFDDFSVTATP